MSNEDNQHCGYCNGKFECPGIPDIEAEFLQSQLTAVTAERDVAQARLDRLEAWVKTLKQFTTHYQEGRDRGEYGFAMYGQSGEMLDIEGKDALDALEAVWKSQDEAAKGE